MYQSYHNTLSQPLNQQRKLVLTDNGITIESIGKRWVRNFMEANASHDHVLFYLQKGSGRLSVCGCQYELQENTFYCVSTAQTDHGRFSEDVAGWCVHFSEESLYTAETGYETRMMLIGTTGFSRIQTCTQINEEITELLEKMNRESHQLSGMQQPILAELFKLVLLYLSKSGTPTDHGDIKRRDKDMVSKFMLLLRHHFATKKMVTDYAAELFVTPSYLNQVVKKVSGRTASYHIQQQLVAEAKRQALISDKSMKEIAYQLGFDNTSHFSKFFKTNSGINFSSFKKEVSW